MPRRRTGKKIDFLHWTGLNMSFPALAAGTSGATAHASQHLPETMMRFRGNLLAYVDGTEAPPVQAVISVGMIVVPEGTGSTVLWSPFTDDDAPWSWLETFRLGYEEYVTDVISAQAAAVFRAVIDSKAMRIVKNSEVQVVVENTTTQAALSVNVAVDGRTLWGT